MSPRRDNTACIAMLEEPGWRTRYISIYGEAARQKMLKRTMILTYVCSEKQLAVVFRSFDIDKVNGGNFCPQAKALFTVQPCR